jgi:PTH1 family peptidyl-tRNA hydrolase
MALFQRRVEEGGNGGLYTVGMNKTALIVGLGNPEPKYDLTRHNVGFLCLDSFTDTTDEMGEWVNKKDLKCHLSTGQLGDQRVLAVKPTTFMNSSGEAVRAVMDFYKLPASQVIVLHDELDIDFGQIRTRVGGSDAGHNGIKSVSQHIGENYGRVRVGIGPKQPPEIDSADFVLQKFSSDEQAQLKALTKEVGAILTEHLYGSQPLPHETRSFLI